MFGLRRKHLRRIARGSLLALVTSWLGLQSALARPAQVILFRHAEKPSDESDVHLSERGRERAKALVGLFTTNPSLTKHGLPVALYAPDTTARRQSQRPAETLQPLAEKLSLPILTPHPAKSSDRVAKEVLENPAYDGKTVVICWVQDFLPEMAQELGVNPPKWSSEVFDRMWIITFGEKGAKLTKFRQQLLPGDSAK